MDSQLTFGLRIPATHPTDVEALRQFVIKAEELGFESIWVGDHVFYQIDVLQPLHLLTWIAAQTQRVRLGTAVMLSSFLNPVLLAKAAATLDYLSNGRLILGMSIGGSPSEFNSIGVPMSQRVGRLVECTHILRALWRSDDVDYVGKYHRIESGTLKPKPIQPGGVPIYYGASSEPMYRRLAKHADGWVGGSRSISVEDFLATVSMIRQFSAEAGRDPDTLSFAKLQTISIDRNHARARERALAHWGAYYGPAFVPEAATTFGTPAECEEQLAAFRETSGPPLTIILEPSSMDIEQLELLAEVTVAAK